MRFNTSCISIVSQISSLEAVNLYRLGYICDSISPIFCPLSTHTHCYNLSCLLLATHTHTHTYSLYTKHHGSFMHSLSTEAQNPPKNYSQGHRDWKVAVRSGKEKKTWPLSSFAFRRANKTFLRSKRTIVGGKCKGLPVPSADRSIVLDPNP